MEKTAEENLQRVGFLVLIPCLLRGLGADPATVLAAAGLAADALDNPEGLIPYGAMGRLLRIASEQTQTPHFGLLLGQHIGTQSLGLVGDLMSQAPSIGVALEDLAANQHRHARGAVIYLLPQADQVLFGYAVYHPGVEGSAQIYDGAATAAFNILRNLVPAQDLNLLEVQISRHAPTDATAYQRYFGTRIRFGTEQTGVVFPASWLARPLAKSDPARRKALEEQVEVFWAVGEFDLIARSRRALRLGLLTGSVSGEQLSARLAIPRRTLHRRLKAQGHSFQTILDETRFELARQLLANTRLPMAEIGFILRYAEQAVFTHAFFRWAGETPSDWRARHVATEGSPSNDAPYAAPHSGPGKSALGLRSGREAIDPSPDIGALLISVCDAASPKLV
jgi:AraC-like DNA-binding protein